MKPLLLLIVPDSAGEVSKADSEQVIREVADKAEQGRFPWPTVVCPHGISLDVIRETVLLGERGIITTTQNGDVRQPARGGETA